MESLGYMLMYFNLGTLPWQGLKAATKKQKHENINEEMSTPPFVVLVSDSMSLALGCVLVCNVLPAAWDR